MMNEIPVQHRGSAENWKCEKQDRELEKEKTETPVCISLTVCSTLNRSALPLTALNLANFRRKNQGLNLHFKVTKLRQMQ